MNRSKNKTQTKVKRTVLSLLNRRSTRVEPEAIKTEQNSNENRQSISAQTSPIKSLTDDELRRHRSSQNINSTDTATTPKSKQKIHICNNRLSHQFGLCCAIDERASTPPVTVRYKSLPDIELNKTTTPNHHPNGISNQSVLEEHQAVIHEPPPSHLPSPEHHQNHLQHSSSHQQITSSSSSSTKETSKRPIFNEIQNSIAVSACRSRLRDKILGKTITIVDQQHSSYPNIAINNTKFHDIVEHSDGNRSFSYDGLIPGSADSLAKQSLIAAQLLNLIPTEKARERNYLSGRLAVTSLFGLSELERVLPAKEVRIFVGTWNMNEQNPPKQMNDFVLPSSVEHIPDVVVIGTQESCSVRFDWEVTLQETLGPSHILLHSASLGTLHLAVFIRRDLIWFCSEPEDDSLSVRPGTAFRTKGAVAISFCLFGTTMLFVTSHLTAHQQKVKERVQDVKRIIHSLDLPRNLNIRTKNRDVTQNFDCVYWCGDLNFRLGEPREKVLKWIENTKFPLPAHMPHGYMHTDQLKSVLANGAAFKDFKEAHITFPPTYKYDPGTQNFDTSSKQRTPAYTDRILYKFKSMPSGIRRGSNLAALLHSAQVECLAYDSVPSIVTSDHKPVWALFRNPIRPGIDSVPLAAGLFNREVYLEGMKRRLSNSRYQGSSAVCVIQ